MYFRRTALVLIATSLSALTLLLWLNLPTLTTHASFNQSDPIVIDSEKVCAPRTSTDCFPGPFTKTFTTTISGFLNIDVWLIHTGNFEPNEQSAFTSALGELDCGPIPPDTDELFCGSVSGLVEAGQVISLTIEHTGGGETTGSHRQRYFLELQGERPTETATPAPTATPTLTPTASHTPTPTATGSPTPSHTPTPTAASTSTPTATATTTATATETPFPGFVYHVYFPAFYQAGCPEWVPGCPP